MADIRLAKPAAGAAETVPCAPEARFVFDFPATDATLARDGDNLAIRFEDGSSLNLEGFYTEYNEENLPSFSIDGTEVAAADFFAAMNEPDLMPAAGPGAGTTPTGGRFHEWGDASLAAGLDHLDGLDLNTGRAFTFDDTLNAVGGAPAGEYAALAGAAAAAGETPEPGATEPEPPAPDNPVSITSDSLTVNEKYLTGGSEAGQGDAKTSGFLQIDAPDGVASIIIGGVSVWADGAAVPGAEVSDGTGVLTNISFDPASGRLSYDYKLTGVETHPDATTADSVIRELPVTVTDSDGDTMSSTITVTIVDDVPDASTTATGPLELTMGEPVNVPVSIRYGADGEADSDSLLVNGIPGTKTGDGGLSFALPQGTLVRDASGAFTFTAANNTVLKQATKLELTFEVTDGDRDTDTTHVTLQINAPDAPVYILPKGGLIVDEANLMPGHEDSSDLVTTTSKSITFDNPDFAFKPGSYDLEVNGRLVGRAEVDSEGNLTFTLLNNTETHTNTDAETVKHDDEAARAQDTGAYELTVPVLDAAGNEFSVKVPVHVIDDVANLDRVEVTEADDNSLTLTLHGLDVGADAEYSNIVIKVDNGDEFTYTYTKGADGSLQWVLDEGKPGTGKGTLHRNDDDSFTYIPPAGDGAGKTYTFDVEVKDGDGDTAKAPSVSITTQPAEPAVKEVTGTVDEAHLENGTHALEGGAQVSLLTNVASYKIEGSFGHGKLELREDGTLVYRLEKAETHTGEGRDTLEDYDTATITYTDKDGKEHTANITINLVDDQPVITVDDGTHAVKPVESFPDGQFDFTFGGNHTQYTNKTAHDSAIQDVSPEWKLDGFGASFNGVTVSGGIYQYGKDDAGHISLDRKQYLEVCYSKSQNKITDSNSVNQGRQDGLTIGDGTHGISEFEIGASTTDDTAEGICFDLGDKIAHSVTVNLGAFFGKGGANDNGTIYDPIPERALLTFYDKNGNIVKQMEVQADSLDGQYIQSVDCYVSGGFSSFVVSALDNVKWAQEHGITYNGKADSDFVVQSVEFHAIIGTAAGAVSVTPGADGLHADMQGYAALFDLAAMRSDHPNLTFEADGTNGFVAKTPEGEALFAASINEEGAWTLTQFQASDLDDITLRFFTRDGDNDIRTKNVKVDLYHPKEEQGAVALSAPGDDTVVDDPTDDADSGANTETDDVPLFARLDAMDTASSGLDDDASFPGTGGNILVYDANDYLIDGGNNIDFLLTDKDDVSLGTLENVQNVEILLKGDDAMSLTSMKELAEKYGISMSEDGNSLTLTMTGNGKSGWETGGNGTYTHHDDDGNVDLTMETANLTVQESASSEAEQAAHTLSLAQG